MDRGVSVGTLIGARGASSGLEFESSLERLADRDLDDPTVEDL